MKKFIFMFLVGNLCSTQIKAQGFMHVNQMPMFYNPSFAGSKVEGRLSVLSSLQNDYEIIKNVEVKKTPVYQNNYVSYDQLVKKIGSGIGVAFYNYNRRPIEMYREAMVKFGTKIAFAPKYQIKKSDGTIRATFSPSIGLGFSFSDINHIYASGVSQEDHYPNGITNKYNFEYQPYDYINSGTAHNFEFDASIGFLYNSKRLLLGLTLTNKYFNDNVIKRQLDVSRSDTVRWDPSMFPSNEDWRNTYSFYSSDQVTSNYKIKRSYQIVNLYFSYTFKKNDNSNFSVTPLIQLGIDNSYKIPTNAIKGGFSAFHSLNLTNTFQYKKFFAGAGIVTSTSYGFEQYFVGYQNDRIRISVGTSKRSSEISLNYYFKPRKIVILK